MVEAQPCGHASGELADRWDVVAADQGPSRFSQQHPGIERVQHTGARPKGVNCLEGIPDTNADVDTVDSMLVQICGRATAASSKAKTPGSGARGGVGGVVRDGLDNASSISADDLDRLVP